MARVRATWRGTVLFFIHHQDRKGTLDIRKDTRAAHLSYVKEFKLLAAGPTISEEDGQMDGSMIIVDVPDRAALDAFIAKDPYAQANLFEKTTVKEWKKVIFEA